ncbi:MAG: hypothetical protein KDD65_05765 [Bacteroidetes bacterium]|nr:hypothetical protein [Bacteroidota bacterium]
MSTSFIPSFLHSFLLSFVFLVSAVCAQAQTANGLLQIDDNVTRFLQRQQSAGYLDDVHLSLLPLSAEYANALLDSLDARRAQLPIATRRELDRLRGTTTTPLARSINQRIPSLYSNGRDFFSVDGPNDSSPRGADARADMGADGPGGQPRERSHSESLAQFDLQVNPMAYLTAGRAALSEREGRASSATTWRNTRGIRASGSVGGFVYFETRLEENQRRDPIPVFDASNRTSPRLGDSDFNDGVLDYFVATGIVGYQRGAFDIRFGRDRNRWGYGIGSAQLSNYGPVYDQLQIRTSFWRIQYVTLFASLPTARAMNRDFVIPKKYASMHRLEVNLPHRIQVSIYESVIFGTDSLGARQGFDLAYLNPVIFLRAVEADRGSPDNVLLGASAAWTVIPGVRVYTDLLLDELRVSEIGNKWWGNKWAFQLGGHFAPHPFVDFAVEYTRLRPYLYAHRDPLNAYVEFTDALGHPAGPNAKDYLLIANIHPHPQVYGRIEAYRTLAGRSPDGENYGDDPTAPNATRISDTGVAILQGIRRTTTSLNVTAGYELLPSLYLEAGVGYRAVDDAALGLDRYVNPMVAMRWGLPVASGRY